ncbi:SRF-type transcription factor (DNA-binding and dimerization domain)-domain-containing protein [Roridomyces roridus]|uniref:SRF-type transcription factor (DNA-binding and dimerization domain)-domain-containing protein n=1 Tax=Roridomyces roridus TaxID=1738132 RepID=A0AAD7CBL4_9AGAR|nr:SRF-type transcription factor (DNA-binding and dimerization domain)-domain-containing protein [Roridomyces roridus]
MRKRQRTLDMHSGAPGSNDGLDANPVGDNAFIADHDAVDSAGDDDDEDEKPKSGQKQGRRKIKIEFIQDKSRRHITFSKRKAGIMKKAYELSTLTGTQVLLLVVSETGLVYTFTTAKLQPLVTQPEGKNLIQACLNAPHGTLPSSLPVGTPLGRAAPMGGQGGPPVSNNMPGGLSISGGPANSASKEDDDPNDDDEAPHGGRATTGEKRRRRSSTTNASAGTPSSNTRGATSPGSAPPPPLSIPSGGPAPQHSHSGQPSQIALGSPTSPQQQHQPPATSPGQYSAGGSYGHHPSQQPHHQQPQHDGQLYPSHLMSPTSYSYPPGSAPPPQGASGGQQLGGLAAAAAQHGHWAAPPQGQVQGGGYRR